MITSAHPALDGRIFYKESVALSAAGVSVTYLAPSSPDVEDVVARRGIRFHALPAGEGRRARPRRWVSITRFLLANRRRFSAWHFHDPELLPLCFLLRWLAAPRVRLVYDVHEDYPEAVLSKYWIPAWLRPSVSLATRTIEGFLGSYCDLIVCATSVIRDAKPTRMRDRSILVRNYPLRVVGQSAQARSRLTRHGSPVTRFVYVGYLTEIRGARQVLDAFRLLNGEAVELSIAGAISPQTLADELLANLPGNVRYLGVVPFEDVPELLAAADAGVVCFLPEPNHIASLPTKLLEYLASGLAVLASDFPAWEELVVGAGAGLQVDPGDPRAIADAVREMASDHDRLRAWGARGREFATGRFNFESEADVLVAAYRQLVDGPGQPNGGESSPFSG